MAIVKMSKFNLLVFESERENLLRELQKFNYLHFLDLKEKEELVEYDLDNIQDPESIVAINEDITRVSYGIETLEKVVSKKSPIQVLREGRPTLEFSELEEMTKDIDYKGICNKIININAKKEELSKDIEVLKAEINELSPWVKLDFPIKQIKTLQQVEVMLGTFPKRFKQNVQEGLVSTQYTYFELLGEKDANFYALIITNSEEEELVKGVLRNNNFINIKIDIEGKPEDEVSKLQEQVKVKEKQLSDNEAELENLSDRLLDLQITYEYLMNVKLRTTEAENFLTTDNVNVIEGYVPSDKSDEFEELVINILSDNIYHFKLDEADEDDQDAPIILENTKYTRAFESLTTMYAYPRYNEIDPTLVNSIFYSFFFGMMIADAGYGLLLLIATFIVLKVFNLGEEQKNTIRFFYILSFFIILWGLIYGSFFAFSLPTKILDPGIQYMETLILSIFFGVVHIYVGLGVTGYMNIRDGKPLDALYDTGFWYMALTGGIILIVGTQVSLNSSITTISIIVMLVGMVGIVLTGGRDSPSIGGKLGGGIYSLYGILSYVGDFISYSRLMALGLSGGYLASAINGIVAMLFDTNIIGIVFGLVIFAGGHVFNLFLSSLSAYVHDIRLTYVEFFGKFYEGGGKAFKYLRSKSKYFNIIK